MRLNRWSMCLMLFGMFLFPAEAQEFAASGPAAVAAPSGYVGAFVVSASGRAWELYYDADGWHWADHGTPPGTSIEYRFTPSAVAAPSGYVGVFFVSSDGELWERYYADGWYWADHGTPPGASVAYKFTPSAVAAPSGYVGVFVVSSDRALWERYYDDAWRWADHGSPPGGFVNSSPSAVAAPSGYVGVWMTAGPHDSSNSGWERYYDGAWKWADHGSPPGGFVNYADGPSAVAAPSGYVGVFYMASVAEFANELWEIYYAGGRSWLWAGHPPAGQMRRPSAVAAPSGYIGVFVTDGSRVRERYYDGVWKWTDHGMPGSF